MTATETAHPAPIAEGDSGLARLQELFRDLFQLDLADLDFGIYRLLGLRRREVESFLTEQLPRRVDEAFGELAGQDAAEARERSAQLRRRIEEEIDPEAILADGTVNPEYAEQRGRAARQLLADYEEARAREASVAASRARRDDVFNYLFAFFSRYYEGGDFMPRRRYGSREAYAIPYNGEETLLAWANRAQHYVKTGEHFRDYRFRVETLGAASELRFAVVTAATQPDNARGDTRYFFPLAERIEWDASSRVLIVPFEYRLPTEADTIRFGQAARMQDAVLATAVPAILDAVPDVALRGALSAPGGDPAAASQTLLGKRLVHFTRRQTTDYFVHRDLAGFLRRELEFYVKDQLLHAADVEAELRPVQQVLAVVRRLGDDVSAFLAQIEDAQRRLFEARKLVLRADYLVPVRLVPRALWGQVLGNGQQVAAWRELFAIEPETTLLNPDGAVNEAFAVEHPTLVVDTQYFGEPFRDALLSSFDDLDEATDGVLIRSDNYHALRLLSPTLAGSVRCIYIDPPYNTGSDGFIYKDRYRHSTWLTMMAERLRLARALLAEDGVLFVSIDDNELAELRLRLDEVFGPENFVATIIWQKVYAPKNSARHFSEDHDYIVCVALDGAYWRPGLLPRTDEANARYINPDADPRDVWKPDNLLARNYYSRGSYEVRSPSGNAFRNPTGTYWRVSPEKFAELDADHRIWWGETGDNMPALKRFLSEVQTGMVPQTLWQYKDVGHTQDAKKELLATVRFARSEDVLNTVKPTRLLRRIVTLATDPESDDVVLDFFAGSGSTGDAVIRQNREDGGRRRFVLVELGEYFDGILLQRVTRAMYAPEWRACRPTRLPNAEEAERSPRLVKVLRLEGYEDALHNLATDDTLDVALPREAAYRDTLGEDAYRLRYLVRFPVESNPSLLSVAALEHPFAYTLDVLGDDGSRAETVDLVETFNLLSGFHVRRREAWTNAVDGRRYVAISATTRDHRRVLVLWRDTDALDPLVERRFVEAELAERPPYDLRLVNADAAIPGFESLDGRFKRLVNEPEP